MEESHMESTPLAPTVGVPGVSGERHSSVRWSESGADQWAEGTSGHWSGYEPYKAAQFPFEASFDQTAFRGWMVENWTLSLWYSAVYVLLIFAGVRYMEPRARFELRTPLAVWSSLLAVFSVCGAVRTLPELVYMIRRHGFQASVCDPSNFYGHSAFWSYMFTVSKLYELGDTAFIVLRKQPLSFLHWYHHATVLVYVWYSYTDQTAPGRWFGVMNYTVHAFMYSYYTAKALRLRVPRPVNIFVTSLQIAQMLMGLVVIGTAYRVKASGLACQQTYENMTYCVVMYVTYLLLFLAFFYRTYISGGASKTLSSVNDAQEREGIASKRGKERVRETSQQHERNGQPRNYRLKDQSCTNGVSFSNGLHKKAH